MSGSRTVNKKATTSARARQLRGAAALQVAFSYPETAVVRPEKSHLIGVGGRSGDGGDQTGGGAPIRLHPGTPPVRDAEHQRKHRARKLERAARRRNRGNA